MTIKIIDFYCLV